MQTRYLKRLIVLIVIVMLAIPLAVEGRTLDITLVGPMTGSGEAVGRSFKQGVNLYLDIVNDEGGINGQEISLTIEDDQNNSEIARKIAVEKIARENKALAVIGHHFSNCSIAAGAIYKQKQIPAISPASTTDKVTLNNPWYFRSIFNDSLQGRFLASYAKKVIASSSQYKTVSIINETSNYGSYLAKVFKETCRAINVEVRHQWQFDRQSPYLPEELTQIINELQYKNDAGIIFLGTHAEEGVTLVTKIKEALVENPIVAPDAFSSIENFLDKFNEMPREKNDPGFYTDGIYVTTPLIGDITNEKWIKFRVAYLEKYGEEPGWHAAFAYDTAMVLVEAMKNAKIEGKEETLAQDRKKIRDYLASLISISDAIEGVTGYNYFDKKEGDSQKPIFIGVFRNQKLISALTQFQPVPNIHKVPNIEQAIKEDRVMMFNSRYSYKINVVYTGIRVNEISEFDPENLSCVLDFYLWFRYQGKDIEVQNIEFINAVNPIELNAPAHEKNSDQLNYKMYHIKGKFRADFLPGQHVFGQHIAGVSFRSRAMGRNNLIFAEDVVGMRLKKDESISDKMKKDKILKSVAGWKISDAWFFQDIAEKDSLGDPDHFNIQGGTLEYSRFNVGVRIKEDKFTLRRVMSEENAFWFMMMSFIMILLLSYLVKGRNLLFIPNLKPYSKIVWFVQIFFSGIFLLAAEVVVLGVFAEYFSLNQKKFELILLFFHILWWLVPTHFMALGADRFIWSPVEERTGRSIPKIVRHLLTALIYLLAFFGIVAFVFEQKLTSLLATSGMIAMIVGMAIQINIANIFSGIAINLERPFRIGDWVKVGSFKEGRVVDINWRTTRIQSRDDTIVSIPNSQASESSIENFSFPSSGYWKYFTIHVDPSHPPERVKKILLDAALAADGVLSDPAPATRFLGMTAGMTGQSESWAANYLISIYVDDYGKKFAHNEMIWTNVWSHLKHAGIKHVMERKDMHMTLDGIRHKDKKLSKPLSILKEMDIFEPFSDEAKEFLSQRMRYRYYPPGEIIVRQGDEGESLFIIVEGTLGVWADKKSTDPYTGKTRKKAIEVARLGAGNFFGEMALLTGEPRTATIISVTETYLYEITKEDIYPLIEKQPEISWPLSDVLSERRMATESKMSLEQSTEEDRTKLSTQILDKIQQFFGFKKN